MPVLRQRARERGESDEVRELPGSGRGTGRRDISAAVTCVVTCRRTR